MARKSCRDLNAYLGYQKGSAFGRLLRWWSGRGANGLLPPTIGISGEAERAVRIRLATHYCTEVPRRDRQSSPEAGLDINFDIKLSADLHKNLFWRWAFWRKEVFLLFGWNFMSTFYVLLILDKKKMILFIEKNK